MLDGPEGYNDEYDLDSNFPRYPFFPQEDGRLKTFSEGAIKMLQTWIFTQVFYGTRFYEIPTTFSYIVFEDNSVPVVPYINLLVNLGGKQVEEYFQLE